ncbi:uncharacterized protein METZ01_LOCUS272947, partial [marine metagenome]
VSAFPIYFRPTRNNSKRKGSISSGLKALRQKGIGHAGDAKGAAVLFHGIDVGQEPVVTINA